MATQAGRLDRKLFPGYGANWDDELFRERVLAELRPESELLDLGAGAGHVKQMNFRGRARRVCGVDPDERVRENPYLDEARVGFGEAIPYADGLFDVVVADNVLEHLERPEATFREVARVLKPGGRFLAKTPNKWHYVPLIARWTPLWFHQMVNKMRGRHESHTFETHYKANSGGDVRRLAEESGFRVVSIEHIEGRPEYLRFHAVPYLVGWCYCRIVNSLEMFRHLRVLLVIRLEKQG